MKKRNKLFWRFPGLPKWKTSSGLRRNNQYIVTYPGEYFLKFIGYSCLIDYWYKNIAIYEKKK